VVRAHERVGRDAIDTFIISMTQHASDVLAVLVMAATPAAATASTSCRCSRPSTTSTGPRRSWSGCSRSRPTASTCAAAATTSR
jgi:hypothetical protein